jgi:hypothetical protein
MAWGSTEDSFLYGIGGKHGLKADNSATYVSLQGVMLFLHRLDKEPTMRISAVVCLILLINPMHCQSAEPCRQIRGRAVWYRGDGFFAIWHIGTHHIFFPADKASGDLICQYFDCESGNRQPALFADFTVCPTEPYKAGAAQPAIVTKVQHPRVVPDWPPSSR